jgi:hypothetical protein
VCGCRASRPDGTSASPLAGMAEPTREAATRRESSATETSSPGLCRR